MLKLAAKTMMAALVVTSALVSIPSTASADGFSFGFGIGDGDRGGRWHHRHHEDGFGFFPGVPGFPGDEGGFREHRMRGGCSEWEAIDTARSYGVRDPQIVDFGRRVVVEGRRHHSYVRIVMINASGCPVAGY